MALPPLDHFLSPVPAYDLATSLGDITQALMQPAAATPSHIVVTDDEHRPLGAIALGRLWASHHTWGLNHAGDSLPEPRLLDCQPWLEPAVEVEASQLLDMAALAELGALAQKVPAPTLVVIDSDGQYLGVLNSTRLLGWLASQPTGISEASQPGKDWLEAEQRAWVLELSHALKNPITTLLGLSTLLLDSRVGALSDRQFRYVSLMRQAIRKLTTLINLLLDWMRLESGQIALTLERVSLQPLADTLLSSFLSAQPEVEASDWAEEFTVRLATAEDWVMADPLRLRQSLHYGLSYLLAQGARPSGLMVEPWGPWIGFSLGSPDALATAGAEYGAAPRLEALPELQTLQGLGLTLARRFSQLHGGEVSLLSSPVWGSRLTLLLPPPPALARAQTTVLVLLACASEAVVEQIYGCLRGTDYRLAIAPCGQTLSAMQERLAPACTLIHWESLPDAPSNAAARQALVDGLEMVNPVVLRAAADMAAGLASAESAGEADMAGKVLSIETLTQRLRPVLDQLCQRYPVPLAGLTILLLRSPEAGAPPSALSAAVQTWLQRYRCRLLQADDLAQANLLSRVWQPQAIVLDRTEPVPLAELQALARYPALARLPLVTLVPGAAGAEALGLTLVPCLEVLRQPPAEAVRSLIQVIAMQQSTPDR